MTSGKHVHQMYKLSPFTQHIIENGVFSVISIFLILLQNIDCRYLLEPPRRGSSNVYPQSFSRKKNIENLMFLDERTRAFNALFWPQILLKK